MSYVLAGGAALGALVPARFNINTATFSPAKLASGRSFLQQRGQLAADFVKRNGSVKTTSARVVSGNKIKADITSPWSEWNAAIARLISPVKQQILAIPVLSGPVKRKIVERPLDAVIDIFDPLVDRLARAEQRVLTKHLNGGRSVEFFGSRLDLRLTQEIDARMDESTKNITRKLRILRNFFVLWWKKPLELVFECLAEGVDLVKDTVESIGKAIEDGLVAVGETAQKAAEEAGEVVSGVVGGIASFFGLGTTGGAVEAPAAGTAATVFGIPIAQFFGGIISVITGAVTAVSGVMMAQEATKKSQMDAAAAASAASSAEGQAASARAQADIAKAQAFPIVPVALAGVAALGMLLYFSSKKPKMAS